MTTLPCSPIPAAVHTSCWQIDRLDGAPGSRRTIRHCEPDTACPELLDKRNDLVLESLSLVSLAVRLGEELGVDIVDLGLELGDVKTLGDLMTMAHIIARTKTQEPQTGATP